MEYKKCDFCGAEINKSSKYCSECGKLQDNYDEELKKLKDYFEVSIVQKPQHTEYRIFFVTDEKGNCVYVTTSERGFMQLQWLQKFEEEKVNIKVYLFTDKRKCMLIANKLILKYEPCFNNRLNSNALTIRKLADLTDKSTFDMRKELKELGIECFIYKGQKYIDLEQAEFLKDLYKIGE